MFNRLKIKASSLDKIPPEMVAAIQKAVDALIDHGTGTNPAKGGV